MARFGQGVNAQLGAISYDDYLRGAMSGSQMTAQGNAAIGQGIGAGLQGIEKGIEKRAEYKTQVSTALKTADLIEKSAGIPEAVKSFAREAKTSFNDPNISLADQAAMASRMNGMFGGIMQSGLSQAMEDPIARGIRENTLAAGTKALERQKRNEEAFKKAVALNTDTSGNVTVGQDLGDAYVAAGGDDLSLLEPLKQFGFKASVTTFTGDDGKPTKLIITGPNSAVEAHPEPLAPKTPSGVAALQAKVDVNKEVARLYRAGKVDEAVALANASGSRGPNGMMVSPADLEISFPAEAQSVPNPGTGVPQIGALPVGKTAAEQKAALDWLSIPKNRQNASQAANVAKAHGITFK